MIAFESLKTAIISTGFAIIFTGFHVVRLVCWYHTLVSCVILPFSNLKISVLIDNGVTNDKGRISNSTGKLIRLESWAFEPIFLCGFVTGKIMFFSKICRNMYKVWSDTFIEIFGKLIYHILSKLLHTISRLI